MPQASDADRERYRARFGDIDSGCAVCELKKRGYQLDARTWSWTAPSGHQPTEEEMFWIGFLCDEWDFGGLVYVSGDPEPWVFKESQ